MIVLASALIVADLTGVAVKICKGSQTLLLGSSREIKEVSNVVKGWFQLTLNIREAAIRVATKNLLQE